MEPLARLLLCFRTGVGVFYGMGQDCTTRGPQVLVFGSIYQGSILGVPVFDPQPWNFRVSNWCHMDSVHPQWEYYFPFPEVNVSPVGLHGDVSLDCLFFQGAKSKCRKWLPLVPWKWVSGGIGGLRGLVAFQFWPMSQKSTEPTSQVPCYVSGWEGNRNEFPSQPLVPSVGSSIGVP